MKKNKAEPDIELKLVKLVFSPSKIKELKNIINTLRIRKHSGIKSMKKKGDGNV